MTADDSVTGHDTGTDDDTTAAPRSGERAVSADRTSAVDRLAAADGADALTGTPVLTERAVIGDELRQLAAWCQIGACIARHIDVGALGEADIRARAVASGWCVDLFERLICPSCQQIYPVWSARPPVPRPRAGGWPVDGAGFQIGRHRRTYGATIYAANPRTAGAHGVGIY